MTLIFSKSHQVILIVSEGWEPSTWILLPSLHRDCEWDVTMESYSQLIVECDDDNVEGIFCVFTMYQPLC